MSKLVMMLSGWLMAAAGLILAFAPQELAVALGYGSGPGIVLILQIIGGLYLGFAALNWMGKGSLLGGIYGKPVSIGNFTHFLVAGLAILKSALSQQQPLLIGIGVVYCALALAFGYISFVPPKLPPQ
ncbi:MAG TPA: hypothetical protein VIT92_07300 [Burkholderiaceae bacterium]